MTASTAKNFYFSDASTFSAPNLASVTNMILIVRTAGNLTLPITSYHWTQNANPTVFDVNGSGSQLHLPNLAGMTFDAGISANIRMYVSAANSGAISAPVLASVTLGTNHTYELDAAGGGAISANSLASNTGLRLSTTTGSTMTLPGLTSLSGVGISGTGNLSFPNATSGTGVSIAITGGTLTAASLTTLVDSSLDVETGASVSFASLTNITAATAKTFYFSDASSFSAPNLASITNMILVVRGGAHLNLPITSYHWTLNANPTGLDVGGSGSQLILPSLTHLTFDDGLSSNIIFSVQASSGSLINASALTTVTLGANHHLSINADGAGSNVAITALTPLPANVTATGTNGGTIS
jgi:hypothetical protein